MRLFACLPLLAIALLTTFAGTASAHGLMPPAAPALTAVELKDVAMTPDAVWINEVRQLMHRHMLGTYLDDAARARNVRIVLDDPAYLGCVGDGVIACTDANRLFPGQQPSIFIDRDAKRMPQTLVAALLAHELVHVVDADAMSGLWFQGSIAGNAGIWYETRAYLVQARIEEVLAVPSSSWTFGHDPRGALSTPDTAASELGTRFYNSYYGAQPRRTMQIPVNAAGDGTVSGWINSWQRIPTPVATTARKLRLREFANPFINRMFYNSDPAFINGSLGFAEVGAAGTLYATPQPGTVALRRFRVTATKGYVLSANPAHAVTPAGMTFERLEGYCYPELVKGTVPLIRYRKSNGDNLHSIRNLDQALLRTGYQLDGVECYVLP